jgi:hypothetical protein
MISSVISFFVTDIVLCHCIAFCPAIFVAIKTKMADSRFVFTVLSMLTAYKSKNKIIIQSEKQKGTNRYSKISYSLFVFVKFYLSSIFLY